MADYKPPMCCGKEMEEESTGAEYSTETWLWCDVCDSTADIPDEYYGWKYEGLEEWYRQNQIEERRVKLLKSRKPLRERIELSKVNSISFWVAKARHRYRAKNLIHAMVQNKINSSADGKLKPEYWAGAGHHYEAAKAVDNE